MLAAVRTATADEYERAVQRAQEAFREWQIVPAPKRGEIIRQFGNALRDAKRDLGRLVTLETGKILAEGEGEVQEMIDICDFAVGLSRQLYGLTIASERPQHRMMEQWHPLGIVGIITAFNFPVAVWAWNSALAAVCGDATLWKPSGQTPLMRHRHHQNRRAHLPREQAWTRPSSAWSLADGDDRRRKNASATRAFRSFPRPAQRSMGRDVGEKSCSAAWAASLLELGGNNAIIVAPSADLDLATRAILFGAVGTAGQRCTTTRRIICP